MATLHFLRDCLMVFKAPFTALRRCNFVSDGEPDVLVCGECAGPIY